MPHFFINSENIKDDFVFVEDEENLSHLLYSLRIKTGEKVKFIDENKVKYECAVSEIAKKLLKAKIIKNYISKRTLPLKIYLANCILKTEAQNNVISDATQLGVWGFYPLVSENCAGQIKTEKWQKIAKEASKQCERADIPEVFAPQKLEEILNNFKGQIILFAEKNTDCDLKTRLQTIDKNEEILVIIGCEGGFSPREFELFKNIKKVTLGNLILKADTAVISALSSIIYGLS